jgi:dihydrolipoamide dehydrogenase
MEFIDTDIAVLGAGPGGYAAAFYAAERGHKVLLIEREARLGGVCLNRGCIPSKALLHATGLIAEARASEARGITFDKPRLNLERLRAWKESVLDRLGKGIAGIAKGRGVGVMRGRGYFEDSTTLRVETDEGQRFVRFGKAIIAVGSKSAMPKAFDLGNPRVMTSREALALEEIPDRLLVIGGGYIGMELGTVYAALGSNVVVVEALDAILAGADPDLVKPVMRAAEEAFREVRLKTKVTDMATSGRQIKVTTSTAGGDGDGAGAEEREELYDRVLVAVGRVANCENLGLENTRARTDDGGFIEVDDTRRTADPAIYAIGDVAGGALLAHKASKEARIAVEAIDGQPQAAEGMIVPAVVFTDPELAWCGLTETEAKERGIAIRVAKFPWSASGRALSFDRPDGLTKLILDPETERILGVGIAGHGAGELIGEGTLAVEMAATARDLAETIHPHPTLSETLMECAEVFYGVATHFARAKKS